MWTWLKDCWRIMWAEFDLVLTGTAKALTRDISFTRWKWAGFWLIWWPCKPAVQMEAYMGNNRGARFRLVLEWQPQHGQLIVDPTLMVVVTRGR